MIITDELTYHAQGALCRGFIAYDDKLKSPRPAVLVAPDWGGRGEEACGKAIQLAQLGYIGFVIDMYGNAQVATDNVQKRSLMTPLVNDRAMLLHRIKAAFDLLAKLPQVDKTKIAAIGYCFGGLCVLDLARSGADVKAVVSFHGVLKPPPHEQENKAVNAKILVLHGYDDPLVTPDEVNQFAQEMSYRHVDWQVHLYGLTAHSFTNPLANDDSMGLHYNEAADRRSWHTMKSFLEEVIG